MVPFADSRYLDCIARFSKALVEQAVTRYDVSMHYPSAIAFTSICCALQYLEVISSVDSITVLCYVKCVSGWMLRTPQRGGFSR
jgi:hypothetical protein